MSGIVALIAACDFAPVGVCPGVCPRDLEAWHRALDLADAELRERERHALLGTPGPEELRAFADERDKLAADRNSLADAYDDQARQRDVAAFTRDVQGSRRDRAARERTDDLDLAAVDRFAAGADRDRSAGDRADSLEDRHRAADARRAAAEDRQRAANDRDAAATRAITAQHEIDSLREALHISLQIGQAQGLLMARYQFDPDAAFRLLVNLSQETHNTMHDIAAKIVSDTVESAHPHDPQTSGSS